MGPSHILMVYSDKDCRRLKASAQRDAFVIVGKHVCTPRCPEGVLLAECTGTNISYLLGLKVPGA